MHEPDRGARGLSSRTWQVVFGALILFPFSRHQGSQIKPVNLDELLKKTWEYCVRLDQISLYFTCTEEVSEKIYQPYLDIDWVPRGRRFIQHDFVYDYQLIRRNARIAERRSLLKENGKDRRVEDATLRTERFNYKTLIFGPKGILGPMAQLHNTYTIDGTDKLWGRPAVVVRVAPLNPEEAHWLYGRAWLSPEDGSVFKIEWEEKSIGNYEEALAQAKRLNAKPVISFATEYEFEKNGIRFPSRYKIVEDYQGRSDPSAACENPSSMSGAGTINFSPSKPKS